MKGVQVFTLNSDEQSSAIVALQLTRAPQHVVMRLAGGSGAISWEDGNRGSALLSTALGRFQGAILFGGTRVVKMSQTFKVWPGIQEVPFIVKSLSPKVTILGIIPRISIFRLVENLGMVISEDPENDKVTIVHPEQDICLQVQTNVDDFAPWDAEWIESLKIAEHLRLYAKWQSLLVAYNGGTVTLQEIKAWAALGRPVVIVKDSGQTCDSLANDEGWLGEHPSVRVAGHSVESLRGVIESIVEE